MKLTHSVLSLTLAAGLAGSVAAYRATSGDVAPAPPAPAAQSSPPARQVVVPGTRFGWAPCQPGSQLEHGTCVVEVVRTVVLPAAVPASQTGGGSASLPVGGSGQEEEESESPESEAAEPEGQDDARDDGEAEGDHEADDADESEDTEDTEDTEDGEDGEDGEDEPGEDEPGEDEPGDNG